MKLIKFISFLAIIGCVGYFGTTRSLLAGDVSWMYGTWWYADSSGQIISGKDKDGMLFGPDGKVDLVDGARKSYLSCSYSEPADDELTVECEVRGETKELVFRIKDNNSKLANVDDPDEGFYVKE